ncbi:MAG TPA: bifunctional 4-hydroxy-2-oxoglutarate aldolase/2-dehydro-3-deoxy-phosphogluconate aldolase [Gaiellaceae bacterium]|nr:bifunctional 4-hydroxy-2-oxoglutarate aldolase/2-dehydro-3-deoxy-phosphogluconate aldolase [Gaiellaceae bacterium]
MSDVLDRLAGLGVVPVLTVEDADEAERACAALLEGGLTAVEITFRTDAAGEAIRRVAGVDELLVGAGTVLSRDQLERALDSGARFAVAPGTNPTVVDAAREKGILFTPGVATPSEVERARTLGCRTLKLFPASLLGGPAFVRAVAPVYPDVRFIPTGGVGPDNLASYLELPSVLACAGTWICERTLLRERRYDEIRRRAREALELAAVALPA